ncbi:MAG: two-component regulator propeller domain-containing protein [Ferruginibacter sp.]
MIQQKFSPKNISLSPVNRSPLALFLQFIIGCLLLSSCMAQDKTQRVIKANTIAESNGRDIPFVNYFNWYGSFKIPKLPEDNMDLQVSQYVRRVFQDKAGNIWFGTQGDGAARYSGDGDNGNRGNLDYFTTAQGFSGEVVRGITEDKAGNIWFATNNGICYYDVLLAQNDCNRGTCHHDLLQPEERAKHNGELAKAFTTYTIRDGLAGNDVWSILLDSKGMLWAGTLNGMSMMDTKLPVGINGNRRFTPFSFPRADVASESRFTPKLAWAIYEDNMKNIWLATDGEGLRKFKMQENYNLKMTAVAFITYTNKDGLAGNNVSSILQDKKGTLWFGTRENGVSRYDGKTFTNYSTKDGLCHDFIWTIYEDKAGDIWMGSAGGGMSKYNGKGFTNYGEKDGLHSRHIQSILEDNKGKLWLGVSGGVYRYNGKRFSNFRKPGC